MQNTVIAAAEDEIQEELNRKARRNDRIQQLLPYVGIVFLVVLFTVLTDGRFLETDNLTLLLNQGFTMMIIIIGATFLYSIGSMDMSLGQVMGISSMVLTLLFQREIPLILCLLAAMLVSVGIMMITATAKNYLGVSPFISSLCVSNVCAGIIQAASMATDTGYIIFPYSRASWLDTPAVKAVVLVILLAIGYYLYNFTSIGKAAKAIGGNPKVAKISGIHVEKTVYIVYIIMGITLAIAGMFSVARAGVVDTTTGSSTALNVMVGIVLGGFPLTGGANGRFSAPVIGTLMVTVLTNGLGMLGYASAVGYGVKGILFIAVVALTYEKSKGNLVE